MIAIGGLVHQTIVTGTETLYVDHAPPAYSPHVLHYVPSPFSFLAISPLLCSGSFPPQNIWTL